jgi:hypothetical protein
LGQFGCLLQLPFRYKFWGVFFETCKKQTSVFDYKRYVKKVRSQPGADNSIEEGVSRALFFVCSCWTVAKTILWFKAICPGLTGWSFLLNNFKYFYIQLR